MYKIQAQRALRGCPLPYTIPILCWMLIRRLSVANFTTSLSQKPDVLCLYFLLHTFLYFSWLSVPPFSIHTIYLYISQPQSSAHHPFLHWNAGSGEAIFSKHNLALPHNVTYPSRICCHQSSAWPLKTLYAQHA